jgi:hypothetical protein
MGDTIWLQVNDGQETSGGERDNTMMLRVEKQLDAFAEKLGVSKLSGFYDYSALAGAYESEFEEVELPEAEGAWFDAKAGELAVGEILKALREGSPPLELKLDDSQAHWPEALVEELEYCHSVLAEAAQRGHQFRFTIVS